MMKMKVSIIMTFLSIIVLCFSGCEDTNDPLSCTLTVSSSYSGYGIDGQNLGSGTFTDTFTVSAGDEFYEDFYGHWTTENKNNDKELIITIIEITDNEVTFINDEKEITIQYNCLQPINSKYLVYDGQNFEYNISFS